MRGKLLVINAFSVRREIQCPNEWMPQTEERKRELPVSPIE
jgi:hypothetical protein